MSSPTPLPSPPSPELVRSADELEELCEVWSGLPRIALDTEFVRTRTFFPRLGLVQVADPEAVYLLDAVSIDDWEPFRRLLVSEEVVKVLHSPGEDLEVFDHAFDLTPRALVDTQIAATLGGTAAMPGYAPLMEELFGVELPKGQQRSNWLKRPLTSSQVRYAGLDVAYLLPAWEMLEERLEERSRRSWFDEEMERLVAQAKRKNDPQTIYSRLVRANLDESQAGALFDLVRWREQQARERNLPRRFVLGDEVLLELALKQPESDGELAAVETLAKKERRMHGDELLEVVAGASERDLSEERRDSRKVSRSKLEPVREALGEIASRTDVPVEFLATRRAMEKLVRRAAEPELEVPDELMGWRWNEFGDLLKRSVGL